VADVDGVVERRGHFLWLESKPERADGNRQIPKGQELTHEALLRMGAFTVITVWGTTDTDMAHEHLRYSDTTAMLCSLGVPTPTFARVWREDGTTWEGPTNKEHFKKMVRGWFEWADKNPKRVSSK